MRERLCCAQTHQTALGGELVSRAKCQDSLPISLQQTVVKKVTKVQKKYCYLYDPSLSYIVYVVVNTAYKLYLYKVSVVNKMRI